ncbi:hypothetical protein ACLSU7_17110 [Bdellovibrio sp. HCB185ZH]|uniref:hypothetical protein n=1 Tax=Bdellovibrio sp. HCB185ZH TaxID=3394235 RepID=UPI0039A632CF
MKKFFAATLIALGFCVSAQAETAMPILPVSVQSQVYATTAEQAAGETQWATQGKYCCFQSHGGGFCELSNYYNVGTPCKCTNGGNNTISGHVCR